MARFDAQTSRSDRWRMPRADPPAQSAPVEPEPTARELYWRTIEAITRIPDAIRQTVTDQLWAELPEHVRETSYTASLATGVPLTVRPAFTDWVLIETVAAAVPAGATGLVQLDDVVIPVPAGTTSIGGLRLLLGPSAVRSITLAGASGAAALLLTGRRQPTYGRL